MGTNEATLESLQYCCDVLTELISIREECMPHKVAVLIANIEKHGTTMRGHKNRLAAHIGQQKRQISWLKNGKIRNCGKQKKTRSN